MKKTTFIFLLICCTLAWGQTAKTPDLSSPEGSWNALISALQTGETEAVKGVCTPQGFQSLIEIISPFNEEEPFAPTFRNWGQRWAEMQIEVTLVWNANANLIAVGDETRLSFVFFETEYGWKLNQWVREE